MSFPTITINDADAYARGTAYGAQARARVQLSVRNYAATFAWCGLDWEEVKQRAHAFRSAISPLNEPALDEMRGIADGAGVSFDDILALNVRTELLPAEFGQPLRREARQRRHEAIARNATRGLAHPEIDPNAGMARGGIDTVNECTAVAISHNTSANAHTMLSQNWDWLGWQREALVVLRTPTFLTLTEAGMLAKIGVNTHGLSVGLNILRSTLDHRSHSGVPVHIVLRTLLERCESTGAAQRLLEKQTYCASSNITVADVNGDVAAFELSPAGAAKITPRDGIVVHTNHFLRSDRMPFEGNLSAPLSSHPRFECMNAYAMRWHDHATRPTFDDLVAALCDTSRGSASICRYPDPSLPAELRTESVAGVIIDCDERAMWIAPNVPTPASFARVALAQDAAAQT